MDALEPASAHNVLAVKLTMLYTPIKCIRKGIYRVKKDVITAPFTVVIPLWRLMILLVMLTWEAGRR